MITTSAYITKSRREKKILKKGKKKQGLCHIVVALPFTFKSILRQKKNCGTSNISPCKNIIFNKKSSKKKPKSFKILL
jgi:hypothetical protein